MKLKFVEIVANGLKKDSPLIVEKIENHLKSKNIEFNTKFTSNHDDDIKINSSCDLLISIGGDGTVLKSARLVNDYGIPILAVNLGTFGFITEISASECLMALDEIIENKHKISRRLMLKISVVRNGKKIFTQSSLNEGVITSSGISKVVKLDLLVNDTMAGTFKADGIIVATPTGSTGYSLAAGGPILDCEMPALLVTPICPFTLSNRPLVLGENEIITVKINEGQRTDLILTVDGQDSFTLEENDKIIIQKSRSKALLIASSVRNYTQVLKTKLNWYGVLHA